MEEESAIQSRLNPKCGRLYMALVGLGLGPVILQPCYLLQLQLEHIITSIWKYHILIPEGNLTERASPVPES